MKIYTEKGSYTIGEGSSTTDRRGFKWESLQVEGAETCPVGKESVNELEEEELETILRKEGMI